MQKQINVVSPYKLQTLYGMDQQQTTVAVAVGAGIIAGIIGFVIVRKMKKKGRR